MTWNQAVQVCLARLAHRRTLAKSPSMLAFVALASAASLTFGGCGGGSRSTTIKSVSITPTSANVNVAQQLIVTAVVTLTDSSTSTNTTVTWEVNGTTSNTSCGSIAASTTNQLQGIYTAPSTVPSSSCGVSGGTLGQVAITAVATQSNTSNSS